MKDAVAYSGIGNGCEGACTLCPRACGVERSCTAGFCGGDDKLRIARAALHFWEEPCFGSTASSAVGAIFFVGCPLHCIYCQNGDISQSVNRGKAVSIERFREICFDLRAQGATALDLVTPMHYATQLREALLPIKESLGIPVICNTGGYDSLRQIELMSDLTDIYLPDYKYSDPTLAQRYSGAPDYPSVAESAIGEMIARVGKPRFSQDRLVKGVLVRHLVLPGHRHASIAALRRLRELFSPEDILLSLMSQYTPPAGMAKPLHRRVTTFEYDSVLQEAARLGFQGYCQQRSSAKEEYTPPFDLTGV